MLIWRRLNIDNDSIFTMECKQSVLVLFMTPNIIYQEYFFESISLVKVRLMPSYRSGFFVIPLCCKIYKIVQCISVDAADGYRHIF